jgi:PAS domain S-box-containing protein
MRVSTVSATTIHLLLVEDSDTAVALIRAALEPMGSAVTLTVRSTLADARAWLDEATPDLVIADLLLPDGRGTDLLPFDRTDGPFPVIVLTGGGNEVEAVEAMKAGAIDYLVKSRDVLAGMPAVIRRCLREWGHLQRQRLFEDALRASEERFRSIFLTAAAGMVIFSPYGRIMQVNPAFCRFTGFSEDELLQRALLELCHPDDRQTVAATLDDLFTGRRQSIDFELRFLRRDGSCAWGHASVACVTDVASSPQYGITLVQDISERKAAEERLLIANRELDAFVHTVSHDLRSPLTPILGYVQFFLDQYEATLDEQGVDMLQEVLQQAERMYAMLEDLLQLSTVGTIAPPEAPIPCGDVLDEVLESLAGRLAAAGVRVDAGPLPEILLPRTLCVQIFDNLIGNAVLYAGGGPIEVRGERVDRVVRLSVRDHGPGVPAEEKERIFDLFYRGAAGRGVIGTGIGLATVRKIARLYGGRAWVEDAPVKGSRFVVELANA